MSAKDGITPLKRRFYLTWTTIGAILLLITAGWVIGQIWTPMSIVLLSAFLVFILKTPVAYLERKGVPRALGAAIMYVVALLVIAVIALIFVPVVVEQIIGFVSTVPYYIDDIIAFAGTVSQNIEELINDTIIKDIGSNVATDATRWATSLASESANAMFDVATQVGNFLLVAGVSIIVGFWVLKDLPSLSKEILRLVGPRYSEDAHLIAASISRSLGGYLRGMVVSCLCTGTMAFIFYSIIDLPYPLVIALFTALMVFIPFIGPTIAWILAGLIGLIIAPITGLLAAVFTIASQMINDNLISPRVMSGNVELHPGIILVVIFIGAALGGVFGMLCAVPLTSAAKSIFVYYFEKRTGRQLHSLNGMLFRGHDTASSEPVAEPKASKPSKGAQ